MNPNAPTFSFGPGANSFVPSQVRGGGGRQQQPGQQAPPVMDSWEDDAPPQQPGMNYYAQQYGAPGGGYPGMQQQPQGGYPAYAGHHQQQQNLYGQAPYAYGAQQQQPPPPRQPYYNQQQQPYRQPQQGNNAYPQQSQQSQPQPQIMQRNQGPTQSASASGSATPPRVSQQQQGPAKTISIGTPKAAAALNKDSDGTAAPAKASTISLSIGGGGASKPAAGAAAPSSSSTTTSSTATPASSNAAKSVNAATPPAGPAVQAEKAKSAPAPAEQAAASSSSAQPDKKTEERAATPVTKAEQSADQVAEQVAAAADAEDLKDLYGADDAVVDGKEHINVVFIGHVDAGKSTMGGRVLVECGMVDKRTLEKYEKEAKEAGRESWYLSWALDSTPQERSKGKTVEVGRAYFETDKRRYTILDAPGHKSFVPSMISGAAQADIAILVISARKGEFETGFERGGQTREHVMLVKTAGVSRIVVAINKMDDPTVQWSKERYDEILGKLGPFLRQSGYNLKTDVTFIPVSGYTGANIKERVDKKTQSFYDGPSLLEHIDSMAMADRKINAPLMMPISEKYKDMGTVVVGKIESGRVKRGDNVIVMPNKNQVEITAIYGENEEELTSAMCGDNVRFRLRGIDDEDINVGFVISDVRKPVHAVTHFEAQLIILDHKNIICAGYSAVMHVHTSAEEVNLSALLHYYDKKTGRKSRRPPQFAKKGQKIVALIEAAAPVCIERFDDYQQLGRFTLRDEGKTIAIGKVTKLIENTDDLPDIAKLSLGSGNTGSAPAPTAAAAAAASANGV